MPPDLAPMLDYENPVRARAERRRQWQWARVVAMGSAAFVVTFFATGLMHRYSWDTREYFALGIWGAGVVYVVARSCAGDGTWWVNGQRAVSAVIAAIAGIHIFLCDGDLLYTPSAVYKHGRNMVTPFRQIEIVVMLGAVAWFGLVGVWAWFSRRRRAWAGSRNAVAGGGR